GRPRRGRELPSRASARGGVRCGRLRGAGADAAPRLRGGRRRADGGAGQGVRPVPARAAQVPEGRRLRRGAAGDRVRQAQPARPAPSLTGERGSSSSSTPNQVRYASRSSSSPSNTTVVRDPFSRSVSVSPDSVTRPPAVGSVQYRLAFIGE